MSTEGTLDRLITMALGARMILAGQLEKTGLVSPLEVPYDLVAEGLHRHGIRITREEEK